MGLLKIGGYVCIIAGIGVLALSFAIPQSRMWLIISAVLLFAAAAIDLLVFRALMPVMNSIPKPEGVGDVGTVRGSMQMNRAMMHEGAAKMASATETMKAMNRSRRLREHGDKASVKVMAMRDTGQLVNFDPILEFDLEVQPEDGEAYPVEGYQQLVSKITYPRIDVGGEYNAFVDPEERTSMFIMWQ